MFLPLPFPFLVTFPQQSISTLYELNMLQLYIPSYIQVPYRQICIQPFFHGIQVSPVALGRGHHIFSNSAPKSVDNSKQNKNKRKMISVLSGRLRGACGWIGGVNDAESFRSQADRHSLTHFSHVQLHSSLHSFSLSLFLFLHLSFSLNLTHI